MSMATNLAELPPQLQQKLAMLQQKLGTNDLESTLDKSLNIANYITDTVNDPRSKLLVETDGKYTELSSISE